MEIRNLFPELDEINSEDLRNKVEKSLEKAITLGEWTEDDFKYIPATLLIPELISDDQVAQISLVDHIRAVTQMCISTYDTYVKLGLGDKLNRDELIAGALLHDVGKFTEYERDSSGKIIQTEEGNRIRHPAMGLEIVSEFNLPIVVRQAIVFHSKEGDKINRLPEVDIIHRVDFLCFSPIKKIFEKN